MKNAAARDDTQEREGKKRWYFSIRINMFFFVTFVMFSALIVRLAYLQFVEGPAYQLTKADYANGKVAIPPVRGNIYDEKGAPIATTLSTQSLFYQLLPDAEWEDQVKIAKTLEGIFAKYGEKTEKPLTADKIYAMMDTNHNYEDGKTREPKLYRYEPRRLKSDLTKEEIAVISERLDELPGLDVAEESVRAYDPDPNNQVAVHLIGYLKPFSGAVSDKGFMGKFYKEKVGEYQNDEFVGFDGIEYMYQDVLRGKNGYKIYPINSRNEIKGDVQIEYPVKGNNLFLTLNKDVQLAAQKAITDHIRELNTTTDRVKAMGRNANAGYAVAMEVDTGRVVAMASMPDYMPAIWSDGRYTQEEFVANNLLLKNGAIRDRAAPIKDDNKRAKRASSLVPLGSTIKPLTILLGLNEKLLGPYETYYDRGFLEYGRDKSKIRNSENHAYGNLTPTKAIEVSSNTFMASMVGLRLYNKPKPLEIWDKYMKQFGLGVSTESGLPYEYEGFKEYEYTKNASVMSNLVFASFGQMGKYTTLQLAQYAAMLANEGKRMKPIFVDKIKTYDGKVLHSWEQDVKVLNEVNFPRQYWKIIKDGMKSPSEGFDDFPYPYARKTGTSESDIARERLNNAVFISFAPADKPKLAVAVVVPEGGYGRQGAAPIARKIFDAYDQYVGLTGTPKGPAQPSPSPQAAPAGQAAQPGQQPAQQPAGQ